MKTFILKAETWFDAKNLNDAFKKLGKYFSDLAKQDENHEVKTIFNAGQIDIHPVEKKE